jgi:potassium-transporting ATPase KdpC subunit
MKNHLSISIRLTLITLVLFGVIYPLTITGIASLTAANSGKGKILSDNGKTYGFEVIGQAFSSDKYFISRPSAVNYNAAATGGSNKGPTNPDYLSQVEERIKEFLAHNPDVKREQIPVDLVTASGGGLDPHISLAAAMIQVPRIAKVREISVVDVKHLIVQNTQGPLLGLFGTTTVNVLKLNIELDRFKSK